MIRDSALHTLPFPEALASQNPRPRAGEVLLARLTSRRYLSLHPLRQDGFTLVELILIMIILAIVAVAVMPSLGDMTAMRASATARKLQSDIAYAQSLAMTSGQRQRVYFNSAPAPAQGYAVVNDSSDGDGIWGEASEVARDPVSGGLLSVTLNAGDYAGVTISAVGFAGSFVEFDTLGRPYSGVGLLGGAGPTSVTLAGGSATQTVSVAHQTGRVSIP